MAKQKHLNKIMLDCLKKKLEGAKGKWVDELPYKLIAPPKKDRLPKPHFPSPMKLKQSFPHISLLHP
ncbi:unnamed protein product [Prunus armeniaca]